MGLNFRSCFSIFWEIQSKTFRFYAGSQITSQTSDLVKIVITVSEHQIEISYEVTKRGQTLVLCVYFSDPKVKIVTRGTSYKFDLLKRYIIKSSWEIVHNFFLENPISIRLVALERGHRGLLQIMIVELEDQ